MDSVPAEPSKSKIKINTASEGMDRVSEILHHLDSDSPLPEYLRRSARDGPLPPPEELAEELLQHPFFAPRTGPGEIDPSAPLPPLLQGLQELKYSEDANSPYELAISYKEDGVFHFKLKKYRIASGIFTEAIKHARKAAEEDLEKEKAVGAEVKESEGAEPVDKAKIQELLSQLYNNRGVCEFYIENYRTALDNFDKAIGINGNYQKAVRKGIDCCVELKQWEKCIGFCTKFKELRKKSASGGGGGDSDDVDSIERLATIELKKQEQFKRKEKTLSEFDKLKNMKLLKRLTTLGIKCEEDLEIEKLIVGANGIMKLPVLFLYPQYNQSDFIEAFDFDDDFSSHLAEMLDTDPPNWDRDGEYRSDRVDIAFIDKMGKSHFIQKEQTLKDILTSENYTLGSAATPGFFILAKNEFCKMLLERWNN